MLAPLWPRILCSSMSLFRPLECASVAAVHPWCGGSRVSCSHFGVRALSTSSDDGVRKTASLWSDSTFPEFYTPSPADLALLRAIPGVEEVARAPDTTIASLQRSVIQGLRNLQERTEEQDELLKWHESKVVFPTECHEWFLESDLDRAKLLSIQKMDFTGSMVARVIVGAKGIGKSTCLQVFARLCPLLCPEVVTLYCDISAVSHGGFLGDSRFLKKLLASALDRAEVPLHDCLPAWRVLEIHHVVNDLKRSGRSIMVLLDEFEFLYTVDDGEEKSLERMTRIRKTIIASVGTLGSGLYRTIATSLCGSSAALPYLVKGLPDAETLKKFPVADIALPLNSSKFPTIRVPTPLPHDVSSVQASIDALLQHGDLKLELRNKDQQLPALASMLTFQFGAAPRYWKEALVHLCRHRFPDVPELNVPTEFQDLFLTIMDLLVKNNEGILRRIEESLAGMDSASLLDQLSGLVQGKELGSQDPLPPKWWEEVEGVSLDVVTEWMITTLKEDKTTWSRDEVGRLVMLMVDTHYVLYDSGSRNLYPVSMRSLLAAKTLLAEHKKASSTVEKVQKEEKSRQSWSWWRDTFANSPNVGLAIKYLSGLAVFGIAVYAGSSVLDVARDILQNVNDVVDLYKHSLETTSPESADHLPKSAEASPAKK